MHSRSALTAAKWIAAAFGPGFIPVVPATWTSALVCLAVWFLAVPAGALVGALGVLTAAGLWACAPARTVFASNDPKQFVMDEVCGMLIALLWLPREAGLFIAAFVLFRIFDVWKPWPIILIQRSPRPTSIMWDDLLAGVFAFVTLRMYLWIAR